MAKKKLPLGEQIAKTLRRRENRSKMSVKNRVVSRARALKITRIRCKRRKQVAKAEWLLQRFENALTALESDHLAIKSFRERRIPKIKEKIAEIDPQRNVLIKQAAKHSAANEMQKAKRIWRKELFLEEKKRALEAELRLFEGLK